MEDPKNELVAPRPGTGDSSEEDEGEEGEAAAAAPKKPRKTPRELHIPQERELMVLNEGGSVS